MSFIPPPSPAAPECWAVIWILPLPPPCSAEKKGFLSLGRVPRDLGKGVGVTALENRYETKLVFMKKVGMYRLKKKL